MLFSTCGDFIRPQLTTAYERTRRSLTFTALEMIAIRHQHAGIREELARKGVHVRDHMSDNVAQLRELEAAAVARREYEAAIAEHQRSFKLKQFASVPSKLSKTGVSRCRCCPALQPRLHLVFATYEVM